MVLILTYALVSGADLTKEDFLSIVTDKGNSKMKYEAGSVAEQLVAEGKIEGKIENITNVRRRIVGTWTQGTTKAPLKMTHDD